jgi:hypothetical protein
MLYSREFFVLSLCCNSPPSENKSKLLNKNFSTLCYYSEFQYQHGNGSSIATTSHVRNTTEDTRLKYFKRIILGQDSSENLLINMHILIECVMINGQREYGITKQTMGKKTEEKMKQAF